MQKFMCFGLIIFILTIGVSPKPIRASKYRQDNNNNYELLQTFGRGQTRVIDWQDNGSHIFVASHRTIWIYTETLQDIAHIDLDKNITITLSIALSPDGSKLAVNILRDDTSHAIQIWDMNILQLLNSIEVMTGRTGALSWHPDSNRLAYASSNGTIHIWDASTQQNIKTLTGHIDLIEALEWSPDGTRLASASSDGTSRVWDMSTETSLTTLTTSENYVMFDIAWSPLGDKIATTGGEIIEIWETTNFQLIDTLLSNANSVRTLAWGTYGLASAGNQTNEIEIWDVDNHVKIGALINSDSARDLSWHPFSNRLVSIDSDDIIRVWDTTTENVLYIREDHTRDISSITWNSSWDKIAGGSINGWIHIWDTNNNNLLEVLQPPTSNLLHVVKWHSDDSQLVAAFQDNITIWNTTTWSVVRSWEDINSIQIRLLDLQPNGQEIATAGIGTNNINIWDSNTGMLLDTLEGHTDVIQGLAWSPNGSLLASSSRDGTINIWNMAENRQLLRTLPDDVQRLHAMDWRFDSTQIVVANDSTHSLDIWDVENGHRVASLQGHIGRIDDVAWRPDGTQIVSVGYQSIFVWDVANGQIIAPINKDWGNGTVVEWGADGEVFATGSLDGMIRIWSIRE